ncbi:SH3 domain-containing protein [Microbulbifer yueqingensis]|uniref:SH3 domain-containing protein n=2 Tax=Microbulbifer yueqingensis TaxID=658219 RepID=A0A1G9BEW4_9GAMM|nr:SH3 domain-containing protein [Microbulbifer yueqingensis]
MRSIFSSYGQRLKYYCESYPKEYFSEAKFVSESRLELKEGDDIWTLTILSPKRIAISNQITSGTYNSAKEYDVVYSEDNDDWRASETFINVREGCKYFRAPKAQEAVSGEHVYVLASRANLRESPTPSAQVLRQVGIATRFEVIRPFFPWLEVSDPETGYGGYIHESLVSTEKPTVELALKKLEQSAPGERLQWAERAAAMAPTNTDILALLGDELDRTGELKRANKIRQEILRISGEANNPESWKAVFAYKGSGVETLTYYKDGAFFDPDLSEENYRNNLEFFHRKGNEYHLFSDRGISAELKVSRDAPSSRLAEYGNCLLDTSASTQTISGNPEKDSTSRIAANFIPDSKRPPYQQEQDDTLIRDISGLLKNKFEAQLSSMALDHLTLQELQALKESQEIVSIGHADLDADNSQDYLVVVNYNLANTQREVGYSALYLLSNPKGNWEVDFTDFWGGGGDAVSRTAAYIGHIDIDGDGIQELFLSREHYEGTSTTMLKKVNGLWQTTGIGSYTGC